MLAPLKLGESAVAMAPCNGKGTESASEGAWNAGMVFRVDEDAKPVKGAQEEPRQNSKEEEGGEETTMVEPVEDAGNMERLIIVLNVENVDYTQLNSNVPLETRFKNVIQENVATMAGLGRDNVAVNLKPGSVRAINTLSVPETSKSEDVRSRLQFDTLAEKVASTIRSVEGIDDVASGEITVRSYEKTGQDTGGSAIIQLPMVILLGIFLMLAVLVTIVVVVVRRKSTRNVATVPKAPVPDQSEESDVNPDPFPEGADDGPSDNGGFPDPPTENDRLVGETNGNEESAVATEEHEEKQEEVAGSGEAEEKEALVGGDSEPPAAATAPADDEDEPALKAALAASLQDSAADTQHGNDDLNNPLVATTAEG